MSEQKYYVKSRPEIMYYSSYDGFESTIYTDFWLDKSGIFVPSIDRDKITKSELAKIMGGALYKRAPYGEIQETGSRTGWYHVEDDDSFDDEWINPLIELVQIEEE